jgi:hypothetical protein
MIARPPTTGRGRVRAAPVLAGGAGAGQTVTLRWDQVALGGELVLGVGLAVCLHPAIRAPAR